MKLLLTSSGLTNETLRNKFIEICNKNPEDISVAFIVTASNLDDDKSNIDENLDELKLTGVTNIKLVDIALKRDIWINDLLECDVIWFEGGNTFYLLDQIRKSGLINDLTDIVKDKVYVGISAGTILATPNIGTAHTEPADSNDVKISDLTAFGWVDFEISPHSCDSVAVEENDRYAKNSKNVVYAIDNNTAILYIDGNVEIVGNGYYKIYNEANI